MTRCLVAAIAATFALAGSASAQPPGIGIASDRQAVATSLGHKFLLRTTITNRGPGIASNLIAHLNVLSLRSGTYVDPEDWSSHRTRYLTPIPPGGSITLTWNMQAVNSGAFGVYVAVLPASGSPQPPAVGPIVRVSIAHRQTLDSGGILPLALGIPGALGLLTLALRIRRRNP